MTTFPPFDLKNTVDAIRDRTSLEFVQRMVRAEATLIESRLTQLKEVDKAIADRLGEMK